MGCIALHVDTPFLLDHRSRCALADTATIPSLRLSGRTVAPKCQLPLALWQISVCPPFAGDFLGRFGVFPGQRRQQRRAGGPAPRRLGQEIGSLSHPLHLLAALPSGDACRGRG